jgi:hypothetical protein
LNGDVMLKNVCSGYMRQAKRWLHEAADRHRHPLARHLQTMVHLLRGTASGKR